MKKRMGLTITSAILSVILWIAVAIPAAVTLKDCIDSFFNGTPHGFNGDVMLYGIPAFLDTLEVTIVFLFPLFIIWMMLLAAAVAMTVLAVVTYWQGSKK